MATVTSLRLGPAEHGRSLSLDEFFEADFVEGHRYELARGVLEVTNLANFLHNLIVSNLYRLAAAYDLSHPGRILVFGGGSEFRFDLPGCQSARHPDFAVAFRDAPRDRQGNPRASMAAEVVSGRSEDRDYRVKREEYLAYGLLEYWVVDATARSVLVLARDGDVWREHPAKGDQAIPSRVLPGLLARVDDLWAGIDPEAEAEPDTVSPP